MRNKYIQPTNAAGEPAEVTEYLIQPTISGICYDLGISRQTWSRYAKEKGYAETVERAKLRVETNLQNLLMQKNSARGAQFSTTARQELAVLQDALHEIMGYAADAFTTRQARVARHIEPVEEVIDDLVETLHARHTRRLLDGKCTVYGGRGFLNSLTNIERIADQ